MEIEWMIATALVVVGMFVIRRIWSSSKEESSSWPAGPPKLPIIGNFHQLFSGGNLLHHTVGKLQQEYGPLMTIWVVGWMPTIVVGNCELVREVLISKSAEFGARAFPFSNTYFSAGFNTIASADYGSLWHSIRKGLHNSSLSPSNISAQFHAFESQLANVIDGLAEVAAGNNGVVSPLEPLKHASIRLMGKLCFGSDFNNEEFVQKLYPLIQLIVYQTRHSGLSDLIPFTRHLPILGRPFHAKLQTWRSVEDLIRPFLQLSVPNTFLYFLKSQNLPEDILLANVFEVFLLSSDSSSSTTVWALGYLIRNQKIQQKLYDEIKTFCGEDQDGRVRVTVQDLNKLEYLQAVSKEIIRMKPIAPLAVPHRATKDTTLMGYKIREGTVIVLNLYQLLYDPKVWEEPQRFMPERFLHGSGDEEERLLAMERSYLPFGAGRRVCAGMDLAKLMIPVALGNLVGAYQWSAIDGKLPDMTEEFAFGLMMQTPLAARIQPWKCSS